MKIIVGSEGKKLTFLIHKSLLVYHSAYFAKALTWDWEEATEGVVTLEDIDPQVFRVFAAWLFIGRIALAVKVRGRFPNCTVTDRPCDSGKMASDHADTAVRCYFHHYLDLVNYWGLGDRLLSSGFKNAVLDQVFNLPKL